ncbi:MAG: CvpA family protein [Sphingobacteriales bacterium]|nr:MAG: CvpA family protein [Sphingobacteriales bacterium]
MNALDLVLLLPILLAAVRGYRKGIIVEVFSIIALIVAIIACLKITYEVTSWLEPWFGNSAWLPFIGYLVTFGGAFLLVMWLGKLFEKAVDMAQFGIVNKSLGAFFSILKTCFMISLLFWLTNRVQLIPQETQEGSIIYSTTKNLAPKLVTAGTAFLPSLKKLMPKIEEFFHRVKEEPAANEV